MRAQWAYSHWKWGLRAKKVCEGDTLWARVAVSWALAALASHAWKCQGFQLQARSNKRPLLSLLPPRLGVRVVQVCLFRICVGPAQNLVTMWVASEASHHFEVLPRRLHQQPVLALQDRPAVQDHAAVQGRILAVLKGHDGKVPDWDWQTLV